MFHALRREELCKLKVKDFATRVRAVRHLKVSGKGGKTRYLPLHPGTHGLINDYLDAAGHGLDETGALIRPVRNNRTGRLEGAITADGVYRWFEDIRRNWGSRSARTRYARPPPPMRSITKPTSRRSKNGSGTPISPPPELTITGARVPRIARRSKWPTDQESLPWLLRVAWDAPCASSASR